MGNLSRARPSRSRALTAWRRRELRAIGRRNFMTAEESAAEQTADEAFMSAEHLLHCACGRNLKATIVAAFDAGWRILTDRRAIVRSLCPSCSRPTKKT